MKDLFVAGLRGLAYPLAFAAMLPSTAFAERTIANARAADLAQTARSLPSGAELRIEGTALDEFSDSVGIDLERFDVVSPGAKIVVQAKDGAKEIRPEIPAYFRGSVDGMRGSVAVFSMSSNGEVRGIVSGADGTWVVGRGKGAQAALRSKKVKRDPSDASQKFECEVAENPTPRRQKPAAATAPSSAGLASDPPVAQLPIEYTAQIAVELDYEFYQLFSDVDAATVYALDLIAFTGAIGEADLGMNTQVPLLQLWSTEDDPYSSSALSRLGQVRNRWNEPGQTNCGGLDCNDIERTTVILLSAATSGGVAYVPGICDSWHTATSGFSYAFAGSMDGDFDIDAPSVVWDIVATAHELGHNFGSQHTHCYEPPIDECYGAEAGCYSGSTSLPSGCTGPGDGCGTIMGYCHLLSGGMGNVSLTYGAGHPFGDTPERVPEHILDRLETEATLAPGCLAPTNGIVEFDLEIGGTGTGTVTSSPAGVSCTSSCRTYFDADEVVTLTATPGTFSEFAGWSGDPDCNDGEVTLSAATTCTATFNGSCGLVVGEDCEDHNPCTVDSCPGDVACVNSGTPRDESLCLTAELTKLKILNDVDPTKDKLQWQWVRGEAFDQTALGDPSASTDYALCVYDSNGGVSSLATSLSVPAGSSGWSNRDPDGWKYSDGDALMDGMKKVDLRTGLATKSRVKLKASGASLPLSAPASGMKYFNQDQTVIVQLLSSDDQCWTSEFVLDGTTKNTPTTFAATGD